jgi:hypothetical protein
MKMQNLMKDESIKKILTDNPITTIAKEKENLKKSLKNFKSDKKLFEKIKEEIFINHEQESHMTKEHVNKSISSQEEIFKMRLETKRVSRGKTIVVYFYNLYKLGMEAQQEHLWIYVRRKPIQSKEKRF